MHTDCDAASLDGIADLRLIDHHCHGVSATPLDSDSFATLLTEGGREMLTVVDPVSSPLGLAVRALCAPLIDIEPHAPIGEYLEQRSALGGREVARRLLAGAGLSHLLIDTGHLPDAVLTPADMKKLGSFKTYEIVRIEAVAEEVFAIAAAADFVEMFEHVLRARVSEAVGLKSIVAYRSGLDISPERPAPDETAEALEHWEPTSRIEEDVLLRHCLWTGMDVAEEQGKPVQLHTGFGDRDLELWRADPARFTPWLNRVPPSVDICFLHCWPYHRQAAALAAMYPNVYFDTGEVNTHAALGYKRILAESLEVAPFEKILYSSDAYGPPELYFVGAERFRTSLSSVLNDWQRQGFCSEADAHDIAVTIGRRNAERLYRLEQ